MQNNTTLNDMSHTYRGCNFDHETLFTIKLYTLIVASICSFVGNLLVILTVYRNKNLQTSISYFIVNMSVSDILFPLLELLHPILFFRSIPQLSKLVLNLLCKLLPFIFEVSYGVSMLTLVAITVDRFSAVMFPLRARLKNKRKRLLVLLLTWVIPMVMFSPYLVFLEFNEFNTEKCIIYSNAVLQRRSWLAANLSLFLLLPLLIMLVLYTLIILKLRKERVPGNVLCDQVVIRRRRQNYRTTMMFIVLTVAFLLCWGPIILYLVLTVTKHRLVGCNRYFLKVSNITPVVFHAINPAIYFIFLSSFRQGFKNIFRPCCCTRTRPQAPANNSELKNIPAILLLLFSRL